MIGFPPGLVLLEQAALAVWLALAALLGLYGLHRLQHLAWLTRPQPHPEPAPLDPGALPFVTVQLPVFNERYVVERLIAAAAALDWPRERLELQVLDDSTDDTTALAEAAAARARARGVRVVVLHRSNREGFKAGALAAGLRCARGDFIAVFDADFLPPADFLQRVVPHLGPGVGMVQARWGHLNEGERWLTRAQSVLLDGHFVVEHTARARAGRWFNFNGTAGLWRRQAIEDAGGWQGDTLTEDLDLSYRAQLAGWRFVYLPELVVPAELPADLAAFQAQQRRWAKGSTQVARKLLPRIWRGPAPLGVKLEATAHLGANLAYPLSLVLTTLTPLVARSRALQGGLGLAVDTLVFGAAMGSLALFYAVSQLSQRPPGRRWTEDLERLARVPGVLALGLGMAVGQSRVVLEALRGRPSPFARTPKLGGAGAGGRARYGLQGQVGWVELGLCAWHALSLGACLGRGQWGSALIAALFVWGFGGVALGGVRLRPARVSRSWFIQRRRGASRRARAPPPDGPHAPVEGPREV